MILQFMKKNPKIVCLGGGIGTVNVLRGIKKYSKQITAVVSMADDGGSGGRLRRLYKIPPPGDLINCLSAMSDTDPMMKKLLTYRFKGDRWGRDDSLGGQKLGNLILVALTNITGSFEKAVAEAQRLFSAHGTIVPATRKHVSIWALTTDGKKVVGEQNIDLGNYNGSRSLTEVHLTPKNPQTPKTVIRALQEADIIIAGPGDLYTTILPVLLIPQINAALIKSKAKKVYVLNVANKPFETPNYKSSDYIDAITKHIGQFPFGYVFANTNFTVSIPKKFNYTYVKLVPRKEVGARAVKGDYVDNTFPLYHDPQKLGRAIITLI